MTAVSAIDQVIAALGLPNDARVDQRVPKKLFLEQGAPTAADKRQLQEGVEDVQWVAALKPTNIGIPEFRDATREYLEIAVLTVSFRAPAKTGRLTELIHRAVPYPLVLIARQAEPIQVSLAHKRASQSESSVVVLDGAVITESLNGGDPCETAFLATLRLADQPSLHVFSLYQGWIDRLLALSAARLTGHYSLPQSADGAANRKIALDEHARLTREIATLRARAAKEKQLNRRVEINLAIQRLEADLAASTTKL